MLESAVAKVWKAPCRHGLTHIAVIEIYGGVNFGAGLPAVWQHIAASSVGVARSVAPPIGARV
jgi:hypothetical protein